MNRQRMIMITSLLGALAATGVVACGNGSQSGEDKASRALAESGCPDPPAVDENGEEIICIDTWEPGDDPCTQYPELCNPPDPCDVDPNSCTPPDSSSGSGGGDPPPDTKKCTNPAHPELTMYWGCGKSYQLKAAGLKEATDNANTKARDNCTDTETDSGCLQACLEITVQDPICEWNDVTWPYSDYWECCGWSDHVTDH